MLNVHIWSDIRLSVTNAGVRLKVLLFVVGKTPNSTAEYQVKNTLPYKFNLDEQFLHMDEFVKFYSFT